MHAVAQDRLIFSLSKVAESIGKTVQARYSSNYWVTAEIMKLNYYGQTGNCFPELVEKRDGKVVAQMRATLWKTDFSRIEALFQQVTGEGLRDGIRLLLCVQIKCTALHGLSLHIIDADPTYTLGEIENERLRSIERLKKEELWLRNKAVRLPLLPKRIAVISVETSKGWADFRGEIENNPWGYAFYLHLFPALLQGDRACASISAQLRRIQRVMHHFDAVAPSYAGAAATWASPVTTIIRSPAPWPFFHCPC